MLLALLAGLQLLRTVSGFEGDEPEMIRLEVALLDTDFLPLKLLTPLTSATSSSPSTQIVTNASYGLALDTMDFHRRMMNEFLCRGYESRKIFEEIQANFEQNQPATSDLPEDSLRSRMLMTDQGSANYQRWLKRSVVLEDLYRHMETADKGDLGDLLPKLDARDDDYYEDEDEDQDFEDEEDEEMKIVEEEKKKNQQQKGQRGKQKRKKKKRPPTTTTTTQQAPIDNEASSNQRDPEYSNFHSEISPSPAVQEVVYEEGWIGFNMSDMYDITLTALAFLAFGIFILNVFMGIITARVGPANVMFVTNNTTPSLPVQKRDVAWWKHDGIPLERILRWAEEEPQYVEEEVARLALFSLNTALFSPSQHCLHFALCKGNKDARNFKGQTKFWLPIWSLGMSWLSRGDNSTFPGPLENIRASALGLAGVQCHKIFPPCGS